MAERKENGGNDVHDGGEYVGVLQVMLVLGSELVGDDGDSKSLEEEENGFTLQADGVLDAMVEYGYENKEDAENNKNESEGGVMFSDDAALQQDEEAGEDVGHLLNAFATR